MNYRNRDLLDLCHHIGCKANLPGCLGGQHSEPAHSNSYSFIHGKGMSIKAHDLFVAAMCHACHAELDQGSHLTKEERREVWQKAHERTLLEMFMRGMIAVQPMNRWAG